MQTQSSDLKQDFQTKILSGKNLLNLVCEKFKINGSEKLKKKIKQEILFLTKVMDSDIMKKEHLQCTNLHHFEAIVSCASQEQDLIAVLETLSMQLSNGSCKRLSVDILSQNGYKWTKVIARNAAALSRISIGGGDFGQKSILDQGAEYVRCAQQHPHHFRPPLVVFHFASGISCWLALELEKLGINVTGERLEDEFITTVDDDSSESSEETQNLNVPAFESCNLDSQVTKLNLDITTMIAYVSSLTNGGAHYDFEDPLLRQQASWERLQPVKPMLDSLFQDKQLYCCTTAAQDFKSIVSTLGGVGEKQRTAELMSRVTVVPDILFNRLRIGGKIKSRSVTIFGTGHLMKALTVTANEGFVRAAKNQGIKFAVYIHESRALTEAKQRPSSLL